MLGSGTRARTAVTQGDLRFDQGDLRGQRRVRDPATADLGELGPGLVPACGHGRGPGQDQAHGGSGGRIAAVGGRHGARGDLARRRGLPGLQQELGEVGRDRDPQRRRDGLGDLVRFPQQELGGGEVARGEGPLARGQQARGGPRGLAAVDQKPPDEQRPSAVIGAVIGPRSGGESVRGGQ